MTAWPSLQVVTNAAAWFALVVSGLTLFLSRRDKRPRLKIRVESKDPENIKGKHFDERTIVAILHNPSDTDVHLVSAHIPVGNLRINLYNVPSVVKAKAWDALFVSEDKVRTLLNKNGRDNRIRIVVDAASGRLYKSRVVDIDKIP
jgi:hypothetical protein